MEKLSSLRDRKKTATRASLLVAANHLFRTQGFEVTTIDDICVVVNVSRRTFFRYFPTKEALVFPHRAERLERFLAFLEVAPPGENPFETLRRATEDFAVDYMRHRDQILAQQSLIESSSSLQATEREIDRDWEEVISRHFMKSGSDEPEGELRARVLAGASIGVIRATMRHWFRRGGEEDLADLGLEAIDCLERGFPLKR